MKKNIKKLIAGICSIALILNYIIIVSSTITSAADYQKLKYTSIENNQSADLQNTSLENSQYAFEGTNNIINSLKYQGKELKQLCIEFVEEYTDELKAVINGTEIVGESDQLVINDIHEKFIYEYNIIEVLFGSGAERLKIIIYCPNNIGKGTCTVSTDSPQENLVDNKNNLDKVEIKPQEKIRNNSTENCIVSDLITIEGFQIKTNNPGKNVAFRTVCKAPNVGKNIMASDGNTYKIKNIGTIYTLDINKDGTRENDVLDTSYTMLDPTAVSSTITNEMGYTYVGANLYNETQRTFGYIATGAGIATNWNINDVDNTYYVRTMDGGSQDSMMEYTIHVRAFIVTTDGVIVYGKNTSSISIAEVADYLYESSKAPNYIAHQYLYNNILNKVSNINPYYRTEKLSYGWDSSLFVPDNPSFIVNEGTLEDLNTEK